MRTVFAFKVICRHGEYKREKRGNLRIKTGNKHNCDFKSAKRCGVSRTLLEPERFKERAVLRSSLCKRVTAKIKKDNAERETQEKRREKAKGKKIGKRIEHTGMIP